MKLHNREFQVLVKPVGARCNLDCTYCYYLDKNSLYRGKKGDYIPEDILEEYIKQHIDATTADSVLFSWHGGEPFQEGHRTAKKIHAPMEKAFKRDPDQWTAH